MESKVVAGKKASSAINNFSKLCKFSQICTSSYSILFFAIVVAIVFCFLYFDIVQFNPSDGVLLKISPFRTQSHRTTEFFIPTHPSSTSSLIAPSSHPDHQDHHISHTDLQPPSSTIPFIPPATPTNYQEHHSSASNLLPPPTNDQFASDSPIKPATSKSKTDPLLDSTSPKDPLSIELSPGFQLLPLTSSTTHLPPSLPPGGDTENPHMSPVLSPGQKNIEQDNELTKLRYDENEEDDHEVAETGKRKPRECNLYEGKWVRDESYPLYRSQSCPFIDNGFRCQENGRPDQDYLKWAWQPSGCRMPSFNGEDMLKRLKGSRLVFVGDSLGRNQWESMLCMLSKAVKNKTSIYEINGEPISKHKGFLIFRFEEYNCSVEYYRSPFLVPQGRPPPNAPEGVRTTLKVDTMDWTSNHWRGANIIVFNVGHWWSYEKTIRGGCYFQVGKHVNKSMGVREAFGRTMRTWRHWVTSNIDPHKTQVFFRTYAPVHFSGGTWKTGGQCHMEIEPYPEGRKFGGESWTNGVIITKTTMLHDVKLLEVTHLSNYRKDAHPSIYHVGPHVGERPFNRQDCSHWCLPGLPDTWNELLYASLLQAGKGAWHPQSSPSQK